MASYSRTSSGWKAQISFKDTNGDFRKKTKSGFRTKADAQAWANEMEVEKKNGGSLASADILFYEYFEDWYELYKSNLRPASYKNYVINGKNLKKYAPNLLLSQINRSTYQLLLDDFAKEHAKGTVKMFKEETSAALRNAYADGLLKIDPTINTINKGTDTPKSVNSNFLDSEDISKFTSYLESGPIDSENFIYYTLLLSGLRYGELCGLRPKDVSVDTKEITVNLQRLTRAPFTTSVPKTEESKRTLIMPERWFNYLGKYRRTVGMQSEFIIPLPVSNDQAIKHLRQRLASIGIDNKTITLHGLRHTHVSWLLSNDVDIHYISRRVGHKNSIVTQTVYAHLLTEHVHRQDEKVLDIIG
ncbi:site-specific integrase [Weissella viridescens]|uniref:Site-specific integrase n=1 Tax=Weissella viridescens TaxID=1629 RepID=A0A3P2RC88_WEIVI|nr:tyrosine-type recombinase/integrase [Weissella viridescens]RRG18223.1 site-specific integrase [Weissella viridescens]